MHILMTRSTFRILGKLGFCFAIFGKVQVTVSRYIWAMVFRQLCGFTHPDLAQVPDVPQQYRGIKVLKDALKNHLQRHFCDVCLEGRKV